MMLFHLNYWDRWRRTPASLPTIYLFCLHFTTQKCRRGRRIDSCRPSWEAALVRIPLPKPRELWLCPVRLLRQRFRHVELGRALHPVYELLSKERRRWAAVVINQQTDQLSQQNIGGTGCHDSQGQCGGVELHQNGWAIKSLSFRESWTACTLRHRNWKKKRMDNWLSWRRNKPLPNPFRTLSSLESELTESDNECPERRQESCSTSLMFTMKAATFSVACWRPGKPSTGYDSTQPRNPALCLDKHENRCGWCTLTPAAWTEHGHLPQWLPHPSRKNELETDADSTVWSTESETRLSTWCSPAETLRS